MSKQDIRQTHLTPDEVEAAAEPSGPTFAALATDRRAHAVSCEACGREVADMVRLTSALARLPAVAPPPGFADRVMARVRLPVPWHRRAAIAVRQRRAAGVGAAAALVTLVAGAVVWATRFPALRPFAVVAWIGGQANELFWQGTIAVGRVAYGFGLGELAGAVQADLTLTSAFAALSTIVLVGVGSLSVMLRLLRDERPELARAR
jgi:hypothetical protein